MNSDAIRAFAGRYDMLPQGSRVLCAVSGGADSVALLHWLCQQPELTVLCAHYNHCLRGDESERDEQFVRKLCEDRNIPCLVESGDVAAYAKAQGLGLEDAARRLRYAFLFQTAAAQNCDRIATAHHADDNAETVLLNLTRGAGLKGLGGIPPMRGNIVRPLLQTTRDEILAYLAAHGLSYVTDSSNGSDAFARNRIRHHVLPVLREQNPDVVRSIARSAELLRQDEAFLAQEAEHFVDAHIDARGSLPVMELMSLPQPLRSRVLRQMCTSSLEQQHVQAIDMLCRNRALHASVDVPGLRVTKEFGRLYFGASEAPTLPERELTPGKGTSLPEIGAVVCCEFIENCTEINKSFNTFYFKRESICGRISVASRREGAKVELAGRNCRKSLKKLFMEAGLTLDARRSTPVLYDEEGVIAVCGFGVAQRCVPKVGDHVVKIEVIYKDGRERDG